MATIEITQAKWNTDPYPLLGYLTVKKETVAAPKGGAMGKLTFKLDEKGTGISGSHVSAKGVKTFTGQLGEHGRIPIQACHVQSVVRHGIA